MNLNQTEINEMELKRIAITHADMLKLLLKVNKQFRGDPTKYYSRLIPLFKGEIPCPICLNKLEDKTRAFHTIDPEVYFGILALHESKKINFLLGTPALVSSNTAKIAFFTELHRVLKISHDVKGYIYSHFNLTQEERVINALNIGEKVISQLQDVRNIDRITALYMAVNFNLVTDLYALSCKEFPHPIHGEKILMYRPRLRKFVDGSIEEEKWTTLYNTIIKMRRRYYEEGNRTIPEKVKGPRIFRKVKKAKEEWAEGW